MNLYFTRGDLQSTARPFLIFLALQSLVSGLFEAGLSQALSWQHLGCQVVLIASLPQISTDINFYP
jgi:hypothetical protein